MRTRCLLSCCISLAFATPAHAQHATALEAGGYVAGTRMDRTIKSLGGLGAAADLAVYLTSSFAIEGGIGYTPASMDSWNASHSPAYLRGRVSVPAGPRDQLLLGLGVVHNAYHGVQSPDNGLAGLVGLRRALNNRTALRANLLLDHMSSPTRTTSVTKRNTNVALQLGASMLFGVPAPAPQPVVAPVPVAVAEPAPAPAPAPAPPPAKAETTIVVAPVVRDTVVAPAPAPAPVAVAPAPPAPPAPLVLKGVVFATNSAVLTAVSRHILDSAAVTLLSQPDTPYEVAGHTDDRGVRSRNIALSARRAEAVRAYLVSRGVIAARLSSRGYGPDAPMIAGTSEEARSANRRVELRPQAP